MLLNQLMNENLEETTTARTYLESLLSRDETSSTQRRKRAPLEVPYKFIKNRFRWQHPVYLVHATTGR